MKFIPLTSEAEGSGGAYYEENLSEKALVRLFPFGIQVPTDGTRPLLLLKDEKGDSVMPVPLNPIEAGVTLTQSNKAMAGTTPHKITETVLSSLDISIESCVFVEIRTPHQYVILKFKNHPQVSSMKFRADEAMSLCLHLGVPLYATLTYMNKSRVLAAELEGLAKGLSLHPDLLRSQQKYIQ